MTNWRIRDFQPSDLDGFLRLWEQYIAQVDIPVYALNEVIASTRADTAVVAVIGEEVVGVTVARAARRSGVDRVLCGRRERATPWH